ncbi:MAG: ribosome biogenesis GTPase Der [Actinomycetota bacterium]|nr:ribosome biogenesis GTPase Der [Actinomycetota bacterium]
MSARRSAGSAPGVDVTRGAGTRRRGAAARRTRPVVVVAGRPNVGKSSLVNRIVGRRAAVVQHEPGVTRDRKELDAEWAGVPFVVVDTGGWLAAGDVLDAKVSAQAERAFADADLVLLVVDVTVGATREDEATVRAVRRAGTPMLLVANKVDDASREPGAWELLTLGAGDPWPVSALHGRGAGDLLDEVVRRIRPEEPAEGQGDAAPEGVAGLEAALELEPGAGAGSGGRGPVQAQGATVVEEWHEPEEGADVPRVALVGRPNAGKSTLFNRLIGEERSIVHDMPGTTRDSIDTVITTDDGPLCFVDTAGMRRPSRTDRGVEAYSTLRALESLDRADIALLVIDATVGATHQDQRLAERVNAAGCPAVVVLNKWDLVATGDREDVLAGVADRLAFLGMAPVLRVSARSGRGVHKILPALHAAVDAYHHRVPTGALNRALQDIQQAHPAPGARVRYGVQGAVDPPTFTLFATGRLPQTYLRYLERGLRERFALGPTPIKLRVRVGGR